MTDTAGSVLGSAQSQSLGTLDAVKAFLRVVAFPVLMVGGVSIVFGVHRATGTPIPFLVVSVGLFIFLSVIALERIIPFRPDWNRRDGQFFNDFGHTVFGTGVGGGLGDLLKNAVFGAVATGLASYTQGGAWPTQAPAWVQLIGVVLLADLGRYVQHRLHHRYPSWWRFHELHHSGEVLTTFKTSRSHFVERVLQQLFMFGPLVALGTPPDVLWWFIVPNSFLGNFAHSNADLRLGPLESIIMGPANHRFHHSKDLAESNTNFSSGTVFWDIVFRTWTNPAKRQGPAEVGIENDATPPKFIDQVLAPFRSRSS